MALISEKGQAAVTDALYFLLVVMGCAAFIFAFAGGYGRTVSDFASKRYLGDYSTSALKTILYSSVSRDLTQPLISNDPTIPDAEEVDYLIALVKQDFADDTEINSFEEHLTENVKRVMAPIDGSFDWMLFFYVQDNDCEFPYMLVNTTYYEKDSDAEGNKDLEIVPGSTAQRYYYCGGSNYLDLNPVAYCNTITKQKIDEFLLSLGTSTRAVSPVYFPEIEKKGETYRIKTHYGSAELVLWPATVIESGNALWFELDCPALAGYIDAPAP